MRSDGVRASSGDARPRFEALFRHSHLQRGCPDLEQGACTSEAAVHSLARPMWWGNANSSTILSAWTLIY